MTSAWSLKAAVQVEAKEDRGYGGVRQRAARRPLLAAKELLHLGSRAAVDQALSRLTRQRSLMRAGRGVYIRPIESRFGTRPPVASKVVKAIAAQRGESVVPHGAAAERAWLNNSGSRL